MNRAFFLGAALAIHFCLISAANADPLSDANELLKSIPNKKPDSSRLEPLPPPISEFAKWLIGTNWGGDLQWQDKKDGFWRSFTDSCLIITFKENGKCFILRGKANENGGTVNRVETKWRETTEGVEIDEFFGPVALLLPLREAFGKNPQSIPSKPFRGQNNPDDYRVEVRKDWGIKLAPPSVSYTAYRWYSAPLTSNPDHKRADP